MRTITNILKFDLQYINEKNRSFRNTGSKPASNSPMQKKAPPPESIRRRRPINLSVNYYFR